jgi:acyl transferase domain-containing protein
MSGRFPGASNLHEFWENIKSGKDSLRTFSKAELAAHGLSQDVYNNPNWIPVAQVIDDADKFDAAFWDISPREAKMMDPQHRVFLEVAWSAFEDAGYPPSSGADGPRTGVWAACGIDGYLVHHLKGGGLTTPLDPAKLFLTEVGNEKDYISTRVSYALDLGGPSMTVASACSSGLVAIAQAAQSLMMGQIDVAIAGASSLTFPNLGYCYEEGMVGSSDGHVRPFDDSASGTLFGDGVGAVVLKRYVVWNAFICPLSVHT